MFTFDNLKPNSTYKGVISAINYDYRTKKGNHFFVISIDKTLGEDNTLGHNKVNLWLDKKESCKFLDNLNFLCLDSRDYKDILIQFNTDYKRQISKNSLEVLGLADAYFYLLGVDKEYWTCYLDIKYGAKETVTDEEIKNLCIYNLMYKVGLLDRCNIVDYNLLKNIIIHPDFPLILTNEIKKIQSTIRKFNKGSIATNIKERYKSDKILQTFFDENSDPNLRFYRQKTISLEEIRQFIGGH